MVEDTGNNRGKGIVILVLFFLLLCWPITAGTVFSIVFLTMLLFGAGVGNALSAAFITALITALAIKILVGLLEVGELIGSVSEATKPRPEVLSQERTERRLQEAVNLGTSDGLAKERDDAVPCTGCGSPTWSAEAVCIKCRLASMGAEQESDA